MPAARGDLIEIPLGETRGRFVISPRPNLTAPGEDPGFAEGNPGGSVEGDPAAKATVKDAAGGDPAVVNIDFGSRAGDSSRPGTAAGSGTAGTGSGSAAGGGEGPPAGGSAGSVLTGGTGGDSPFPGVTILGGFDEAGTQSSVVELGPTRPVRTAYGVYAVSTERSGGGLPSFGVFGDEQVYTVYLDPSQGMAGHAPAWTVEFAVPPETFARPNEGEQAGSEQGLVLPFPAVKPPLPFPEESVRRHFGEMIIVYALITQEGMLSDLSIKQSPDESLNAPALAGLSEWRFRPAILDGRPVAVKALLGIPLWLPQ